MFKEYDIRAKEILKGMTLEEKIGQLNQSVLPGEDRLEEYKDKIRRGEIGSIILTTSATAGNDEQKAIVVEHLNSLQKTAMEESRVKIPMIYGRDVIHGHHTVYPIPLASAASFDPELVRQCYRCIAEDATSESTHWTFSPMLDLCRDPRWGRIIEGPGEDPYLASRMAEAYVKGFQGDDLSAPDSMVACAKHYVGYGFSEGGRDYHRTEISDYTLYNYVLPPFRAAVKAGAGTVMSSFNDINGEPVTSSKKYLTDILRGNLGFEGFVIADWFAVSQLKRQGLAEDMADCTRLALNAGLDMDMADEHYINTLRDLVLSGEVSMETLDEAVLRVLRVKLAAGLFDNPYVEAKKIDRAHHVALSEKLAAESMVLVKNDGVLPLRKDQTIVASSPFFDDRRLLHGSWALDGYLGASTPSLREALNEVVGQGGGTVYTCDYGIHDNSTYWLAHADTVLLLLGESHTVTGEARCRSDISLTPDQEAICRKAKATGKKVVGVIFCGRPLALESVEPYLDAILIAWHGGTRAAHAAIKTVFGDYNPSGRAPVTFVRRTGHIPLYYNVTSSGRPVDGYYGEHPEFCYTDSPASPLYPFGYGLSYTTFEYSDAKAERCEIGYEDIINGEKLKFTVKVKNTGDRAGKETAQIYIRDLKASYMRPLRELKGFKKIALEPGEEKEVTFELGYEELGFYLPDGSYTLERGLFEIYIGKDCLAGKSFEVFVK
ncbi:MAG: glycoside hydrolase family 3 C-terminal domain-containing protein [Clostridia bacterium]|nr:glycoside hydrolase family 3 C-terminal domain-containing protein [Clostridia bacterium]